MCGGFQKDPLGLGALSKDLLPRLAAQGEAGGGFRSGLGETRREVGSAHRQDTLRKERLWTVGRGWSGAAR